MTPSEFSMLLQHTKMRAPSRTHDAVQDVLVDDVSICEAARRHGINPSAVSRAISQLLRPRCPTCGRRMHRP